MFTLAHIRHANLFVRLVAASVILTFSTFILSPTVMAAQADIQQQLAQQAIEDINTNEQAQLSRLVAEVKALYQTLQQQLADNLDTSSAQDQLSELLNQAQGLDDSFTELLEQEKQWLLEQQRSPSILGRQQQQSQHYRQEMDRFIRNLEKVVHAKGNQLAQKVEQALKHLKEKKSKRTHQPFNPENLPFRPAKTNKGRKPKTTKEQFIDAGLYNNPLPRYAALGDFKYDQLVDADNPAYLAETDEIVLTEAIKNKAQELDYSPVNIFNYVYNNIHWSPVWGGSQDAELTLDVKRGSAMDISSLLIALLRASGFPARYVHGSIEMPPERFSNWIGNVDNVQEAVDLASASGIPVTLVTMDGVLNSVRIEHIWVEAAIDFHPSRGVINRNADRWAPLDPSFKTHTHEIGIDVQQITQLDVPAMYQEVLNSGTVNDAEGWFTGLNQDNYKQSLLDAQGVLSDYISTNLTNPTEKELIGGPVINPFNFRSIPSSLSNKIVVVGARYATLPDDLRYQVTIKLYHSQLDRSLSSPSLSTTLSLAEIGKKRLSIHYDAATEEDATLISDVIASGAKELPLYLIQQKPVIQLDNEVIKTGSAVDMGSDQPMDIVVSSPQGQKTLAYSPIAGDNMVVSVNTGNISQALLNERIATVSTASVPEELHLIGLGYWLESDIVTRLSAKAQGVNVTRMPSVGVISAPLKVKYSFGIPNKGYYWGRMVDIKLSELAISGDTESTKRHYMRDVGALQSYLESSILEQMLQAWHGTGLSAMQALMDANQQNIKIFTINHGNASQILSQLQLPEGVMDDIHNALNAGYEITTPQRIPEKPVGTQGAGYIIIDPVTGAGSYRISGGLDGADANAPCAEPEPEPQPLATAFKVLLLTAIILLVLAGSGGLLGPAVATVMSSMGLSFLAFPVTAGDAICNPRPLGKHLGGNSFHNNCADFYPPNKYLGSDICISNGESEAAFDAISGNILWEAKTDNLDNWEPNKREFFAKLSILGQWQTTASKEYPIAKSCLYQYRFIVGDAEIAFAAQLKPSLASLVDRFEVDANLCLQPWTGVYPKR